MSRPGSGEPEGVAVALVRTIGESELPPALLDIAEAVGDYALEPGLLRDIPVLGSLAAGYDAYKRIGDQLLARKILAFLRGLETVGPRERADMLQRLEREPAFARRVGERLLAILVRLDDRPKAELIGRAFAAYGRGHYDGEILARLVSAIDRLELVDLDRLESYHLSGHTSALTLSAFASVGLAHIPHGMATAFYVENAALTHPMLQHVIRGKV